MEASVRGVRSPLRRRVRKCSGIALQLGSSNQKSTSGQGKMKSHEYQEFRKRTLREIYREYRAAHGILKDRLIMFLHRAAEYEARIDLYEDTMKECAHHCRSCAPTLKEALSTASKDLRVPRDLGAYTGPHSGQAWPSGDGSGSRGHEKRQKNTPN